jgi:hypothetical protein
MNPSTNLKSMLIEKFGDFGPSQEQSASRLQNIPAQYIQNCSGMQ